MIDTINELFLNGKIYFFISSFLFFNVLFENSLFFRGFRIYFASFSFFFLFLFTGLRWETGTDWDSYKDLFDSIEFNWNFLLNVYSFDIGYVFFNAIVRIFTNNYTFFLLLDSLFALLLLFAFIRKYSPNPNLSLFVFYNAFFVSQFMGSNRRIIALVFGLYFFVEVFYRRKTKSYLLAASAFSFHRSSLVSFFALLLPFRRFSLFKVLFLLSFGLIIGVLQIPSMFLGNIGKFFLQIFYNPIFEKLSFYSDNSFTPESVDPILNTALSFFKRSIFLFFYYLIILKNKGKLDPLTDFFFNIYIFGFFMYLSLNGSTIFQVLSAYFTFIEIVLIGRMWSFASRSLKLGFLIYLFLYGILQLISALNSYPELYMPYKSVFVNL